MFGLNITCKTQVASYNVTDKGNTHGMQQVTLTLALHYKQLLV